MSRVIVFVGCSIYPSEEKRRRRLVGPTVSGSHHQTFRQRHPLSRSLHLSNSCPLHLHCPCALLLGIFIPSATKVLVLKNWIFRIFSPISKNLRLMNTKWKLSSPTMWWFTTRSNSLQISKLHTKTRSVRINLFLLCFCLRAFNEVGAYIGTNCPYLNNRFSPQNEREIVGFCSLFVHCFVPVHNFFTLLLKKLISFTPFGVVISWCSCHWLWFKVFINLNLICHYYWLPEMILIQ